MYVMILPCRLPVKGLVWSTAIRTILPPRLSSEVSAQTEAGGKGLRRSRVRKKWLKKKDVNQRIGANLVGRRREREQGQGLDANEI